MYAPRPDYEPPVQNRKVAPEIIDSLPEDDPARRSQRERAAFSVETGRHPR